MPSSLGDHKLPADWRKIFILKFHIREHGRNWRVLKKLDTMFKPRSKSYKNENICQGG